jgi:hypothetical protein
MNPATSTVRDGVLLLAELPPWLTAPEGDVVGAALRGFNARLGGEVVNCDRHAVRLRAGFWAGRYDVRVRRSDGSLAKLVLHSELRPPGDAAAVSTDAIVLPDLGLTLYPEAVVSGAVEAASDPGLPALRSLTDPRLAARYIGAALAANPRYFGARIATCEPEIMRYKPGSRCTLRYHIGYVDDSDAPRMVIAKTHRGDKGLIAWKAMNALWGSPLASTSVVSIAEPLSYDADQRILLQGPVAGEITLKDVLSDALLSPTTSSLERARSLLDATADGLVALHQSGAEADDLVTLADDLAEARDAWRRLTSLVPEIDGAADELFAQVEAVATSGSPDPLVPSHRSFRPAQVLVDEDHIAFIDFDGFCRSEPALDVALFRATLRCYGASLPLADGDTMRDRLAVLDEWCDRFLTRYRRDATVSPERVGAWEILDVFVHLQNAWTKARPSRPATALPVLERLLTR